MARQTRSTTRPSQEPVSDTRSIMQSGKAVSSAVKVTGKTAARKKTASGATLKSTLKASMPVVKTPAKKQKLSASTSAATPNPPTTPAAPPAPFTHTGPSKYTPTLLPPTLSFSLPSAISHLTSHDPRFGNMFTHIPIKPFQPPLEAIDPFKTLVTSIIGQQVSWMAARAINKRFQELFGYTEESGGFPSPVEVAGEDVMRLKGVGLSLRKAEYVICLAQHFVDGRLSTELLRDGTDEEVSKALIAVRGIGQWTVDMSLMFSLRRPDVLPVGDLGVQKGLLRWILAAHGALPKSKSGKAAEEARKKYGLGVKSEVVIDKVAQNGSGEIDTTVAGRGLTPNRSSVNLPPTPLTPGNDTNPSSTHLAALHTPSGTGTSHLPITPLSPGPSSGVVSTLEVKKEIQPTETLETSGKDLPPPAPETFLEPLPDHPQWNLDIVAPTLEGLSIETMKSRLSGKKAKGGAYLTPAEMDALTEGWKPYRSLGVYYMWPAGEEF